MQRGSWDTRSGEHGSASTGRRDPTPCRGLEAMDPGGRDMGFHVHRGRGRQGLHGGRALGLTVLLVPRGPGADTSAGDNWPSFVGWSLCTSGSSMEPAHEAPRDSFTPSQPCRSALT